MRLLTKLLVGILGATAVPLAITGAVSTRLSERTLRQRIQQDFVTLAAGAAEDVRRNVSDLARALAVYPELADLERASPEVATGVLRVAYRAHEDLAAIVLLDDDGLPLVGPVGLSDPAAAESLGRIPLAQTELNALVASVPVRPALQRGFAAGAPDLTPAPHYALGVAVGPPDARRVLGASVSLARVGARLRALSVGGTDVLLVDRADRVITGGAGERSAGSTIVPPPGAGATILVGTIDDDGVAALAAYAPIDELGLGVLVTQPEALAMAAVADLRRRQLYWVAVAALCALVVGVGLARDVSRRVRRLGAGTKALAEGRFVALPTDGRDELADLAGSFNRMASDLGRAQSEIVAWGRELERRVDEKTAELRAAEEQLLRARSLTAVGTLGAGMAHEINNPLCGVLGAAQILLMDTSEGDAAYPLLREIENQAQRIRQIVENLVRLGRAERGDNLVSVELATLTAGVADRLDREALAREKISVERDLAEVPPLRANRKLLEEAVVELVTNARRAMPDGGRITLATSSSDPRLCTLRVTDTGTGMDRATLGRIFDPFFTTKATWRAQGMGLTLVHKIVVEHGGTITVDSEPGRGSTFSLTFPAEAQAHLT